MTSPLGKLNTYISKLKRAISVLPWLDELEAMLAEAWPDDPAKPSSKPSWGVNEQAIISLALKFQHLTAHDISAPRSEMAAVDDTATFAEVLAQFKASGHTSLPVYGKSLDDILGIIDLKTMLTHVDIKGTKIAGFNLKNLIKPATFVPESMTLAKVLSSMKHAKTRVVLVTDEYGGTSGLLTLRNMLEELVGNSTSTTELSAGALTPLGSGRYKVSPTLDVEELAIALNMPLVAPADVMTLGGWVLAIARKVPQKSDIFQLAPTLSATVTAATPRRIVGLEIKIS